MGDNLSSRLLDGRYEIPETWELLGEDKTAVVVAAYDRQLDRQVVVKVIEAGYALTPEVVGDLSESVRSIINLSHPHILNVYDLVVEDVGNTQRFYLVMQLARGGALADRLESGPLGYDETQRILQEVCAALDYAHARGICHLDLRPHNILLDEQGNSLVANFRVTKPLIGAIPLGAETDADTQDYASPEQLSGEQGDASSDVYALGIMLHQMLTGELPKRGVMGVDPAIYPSKSVPSAIQSVIERATQSDPRRRYRTPGELIRDFDVALYSSFDHVALPPLPPIKTTNRRRARNWLVASGLALLVALVSLFLIGPKLTWPEPTQSTSSSILSTATSSFTPAPQPSPMPTPSFAPSVTPTATPFPTTTPMPGLPVRDETLDVYTGPGNNYDVLGQVRKGASLTVLGRSANANWLQVDYLGWLGWVPAESVVADADLLALPTAETPIPPPNRPPSIQGLDMASASIEVWGTIAIVCNATDPDNDHLTYLWEASDGLVTGEGYSVTYTAPETAGVQTIHVSVRDEHGSEARYSVQVQIIPVYPPPGMSEPAGVFGDIWHGHPEVRRRLGWATGEASTTFAAQESFERGIMFWREDTDEIYVLVYGGDWQVYTDTWEEGMDEYSCSSAAPRETPPTPKRGIGKVWCQQLGGSNATIGWATNDEQGYYAHWRSFEHGLMWQSLDEYIHVLHEDSSWESYPHLATTSGNSSSCPDAPAQQIHIGDRVRVCTAYDRLVVRTQPQPSSPEITRLEPGTRALVVDGLPVRMGSCGGA